MLSCVEAFSYCKERNAAVLYTYKKYNTRKRSSKKMKRNNKKSFIELNKRSRLYTMVKAAEYCPYCHAKMVIDKAEKYQSNQEGYVLVCSKYNDGCNTMGSIKKIKGGFQIISTPASLELRKLRAEAHYYMESLIKTGLLKSKDDVYSYLNSTIVLGSGMKDYGVTNGLGSIGTGNRVHVGECREYGCQQIILTCIRYLYENRKKIGEKFPRWKGDWTKDPETERMLREITYVYEPKESAKKE